MDYSNFNIKNHIFQYIRNTSEKYSYYYFSSFDIFMHYGILDFISIFNSELTKFAIENKIIKSNFKLSLKYFSISPYDSELENNLKIKCSCGEKIEAKMIEFEIDLFTINKLVIESIIISKKLQN